MSRVTPIVIAATLLMISSEPASAQMGRLGGMVSGAVERKVDQRVQQEIDALAGKLVNQAFDALFMADSSSASGGKPLFNLLPNAPTEAQYEFGVVLTYEVQTTDAKGKAGDKASMMMHFATDQPYMGAKFIPEKRGKDDAEALVIFDMKNESMVMLMESSGNKFSMAYGWRDAASHLTAVSIDGGTAEAADEVMVKDIKFTRIGSKKIAGYEADGFRTEDQDGVTEVWVTRDPALRFGGLMGATASMKQFRAIPSDYPVGMMLETVHTARTGEKSRVTASKVDTKAKVKITMADYPPVGQGSSGK